MANHISNKLTMLCDDATADRIFSELAGKWEDGEENPFDFNCLKKYPEHFQKADEAARKWEKENKDDWKERPKDGYNSGGYEWCRDNWGTKWNAYQHKKLSNTSIYFQTAWCAAKPIFDALSAKYPELEFIVEYADEDIGSNAGKLHYKNGLINAERFDGVSAVKLYFQLNAEDDPKDWGFDPETFIRLPDDEEAA